MKYEPKTKTYKGYTLHYCWCGYPTMMWVIYIDKVTKILDERGIEYYNEYSEAGWVYRYKVSKKADNIAKAECKL
jgi:hypothetical protein